MMAESSGLSKAAKKNQKRRGNQDEPKKVDVIQELRDQLSAAKANKNHTLASELRQKLWIAQDLNAGYKPAIDKDDHNAQKILTSVTEGGLGTSKATTKPESSASTIDQDEKKMRNLQKKLKQIEELKKKKEAGEKLQDNQLRKIETETDVLEEIEHLKKLMTIPVKT